MFLQNSGWFKVERLTRLNISKDVEQLELSYIAHARSYCGDADMNNYNPWPSGAYSHEEDALTCVS